MWFLNIQMILCKYDIAYLINYSFLVQASASTSEYLGGLYTPVGGRELCLYDRPKRPGGGAS